MTVKELKELLKKAWSRETSADPENWKPENPAFGQCVLTAFVVQDFFGGEIVRGDIKDIKTGKILASHYWNRFSDGKDLDLTKEQLPSGIEISERRLKKRNHILASPKVRKRYILLKSAIEELINTRVRS